MIINDYYMNVFNNEIVKGKKVLLVPIISFRDYATNLYNLSYDGNIKRLLNFMYRNKNNEFTLALPKNVENLSYVLDFLIDNNIDCKIIKSNYFKENANATRYSENILDLVDKFDQADTIIFEGISIKKYIPHSKGVFWAYYYNSDLLKEYHEINKYFPIINSLFNVDFRPQLKFNEYSSEAFKLKSYERPSNFVFIPFRTTDPTYKVDYIIKIARKCNKEIIMTNPNSAENNFGIVSISPNKYYGALALRPIIVYLDDLDTNWRTSLFEFAYTNCRVICLRNENFIPKNLNLILDNITELETVLNSI